MGNVVAPPVMCWLYANAMIANGTPATATGHTRSSPARPCLIATPTNKMPAHTMASNGRVSNTAPSSAPATGNLHRRPVRHPDHASARARFPRPIVKR